MDVLRMIIIIFISFSGQTCVSEATRTVKFRLETNTSRGTERLGPGWIDSSVVSCAISCWKTFDTCRSFMFNAKTGLCTPGSVVKYSFPGPNATEGNLYYSKLCSIVYTTCPTSEGFSIQSSGSTTACVGLFQPPIPYENASVDCIKRGGFLMSVKTSDKLQIFKNILTNQPRTWVGCDDRVQEGRYVWEEDGQEVTDEEINTVFNVRGLNNWGSDDDCCCKWYGNISDCLCDYLSSYACEIKIS